VFRSTDPARVAAPTIAEPWTERGIEPVGSADRIAGDQPERGLLWVVEGAVTVTRRGRAHEIRRGSVAAYRLGGGLLWTAPDGTRVRWSPRAVRLEPGEVAPWTVDLALDVPPSDAPPERPRRRTFALLAIAMSWAVALTVAWCYDQAHGTRMETRSGVSPGGVATPSGEARDGADRVLAVFEAAGLDASEPKYPGGKRHKISLTVVADRPVEAVREALAVAARGAFESDPLLTRIVMRLVDADGHVAALAMSSRGTPDLEFHAWSDQGTRLHEQTGAPGTKPPAPPAVVSPR
jgi:hypothetical protein